LTKCPIGGGFSISGFRLLFVLGASDPRPADSPTGSYGGSPGSDAMPPFQRVQRACGSLELLHSMKVEEAVPPFGGLLRRFRSLDCCQGDTCRHWRTRDRPRGGHQSAWSNRPAPPRSGLPPPRSTVADVPPAHTRKISLEGVISSNNSDSRDSSTNLRRQFSSRASVPDVIEAELGWS
jgi:hypothetical protein